MKLKNKINSFVPSQQELSHVKLTNGAQEVLQKAKGEEFWIRLIKTEPANSYYYKKLAEWYAENNKKKHAIETIQYASKLDPDDGEVIKILKSLK